MGIPKPLMHTLLVKRFSSPKLPLWPHSKRF